MIGGGVTTGTGRRKWGGQTALRVAAQGRAHHQGSMATAQRGASSDSAAIAVTVAPP
jgi:hypothetical protein